MADLESNGTPRSQGNAQSESAVQTGTVSPDDLKDLREAARQLMRQAAFESAAPLWTRIAALAPEDVEPRMAMARIHLRGGRPLEALDFLGYVLDVKPNHAEARKLRSTIARGQISRIANEINSENAKQFDLTLEALTTRLGDDPYLERVRSYAALIAAPETVPVPAAQQKRQAPVKRARAQDHRPILAEEPASSLIKRIETLDENALAELAGAILHEAERLIRENVWMAHAISAALFKRGDFESAKNIYAGIAVDESEFWLEAARRAMDRNEPDSVVGYCMRAAACGDADRASFGKASKRLVAAGAVDAALALWRGLSDYRKNIATAVELLRILADAGRFDEFMDECGLLLTDAIPIGTRSEADAKALVTAFQILRRVSARHRTEAALARLYAIATERDDGSALVGWILGILANARHDRGLALQYFEGAKAREGSLKSLGIDPDGEIALLHARFHDYGSANAALRRMQDVDRSLGGYAVKLGRVKHVADFCGPSANPLFPECLIDIIFDEISKTQLGFEPQPGHLLTIGSSLRQGGSERQTVTLLSGLSADPRVHKAVALRGLFDSTSLAAESLEKAARHDDWERVGRTPPLSA